MVKLVTSIENLIRPALLRSCSKLMLTLANKNFRIYVNPAKCGSLREYSRFVSHQHVENSYIVRVNGVWYYYYYYYYYLRKSSTSHITQKSNNYLTLLPVKSRSNMKFST
jgi:hypothetical protein